MRHKGFQAAAVLATVLAMTACSAGSGGTNGSSPGADKGPVKIGMILTMTGAYSVFGSVEKEAAEQEVAAMNKAGGIDGRQIELIVKDDKTDVTQSVTEFNQLAADKSVAVILSSTFASAAAATAESAKALKIPTVALSSVLSLADGSNKWAFTEPGPTSISAGVIMEYLAKTGVKNIAITYAGSDVYGQAGIDGSKAAAKKNGINIVLAEPYDKTATDFTPLVTHVKDSKADGLLMWGSGNAPIIISKQMAGSGMQLYGTATQSTSQFIKAAGPASEGVIVSSLIPVVGDQVPAGPLKDMIDEFVTPWKAKNKEAPPLFAFGGVAALQIVTSAIHKAGSTDRAAIRDALEKLDVLTIDGRFKYSPTDHAGVSKDAYAIMQVKDGKFVATDYTLDRFKTHLPK